MKNISIFAVLLLITFSACKKDDNDSLPTPVEPSKKLTSIAYANNQYPTEKIEYDATGRVKRYVGSEDILTYNYLGSEVLISQWRVTENREVFSFKGQFNAKGYIFKGTGISKYIAGTEKPQTYTIEYNSNGNMTRETINEGETIYKYEYTYSNGNMSELKLYTNGVFTYGGAWEYDLSKKDKSGLNWDPSFGPNTFTGKTNQDLVTKYTGNTGWFVKMAYTFDNQGYQTSNTQSYSNGTTSKLLYSFE